jgi:hypothetical protein
MDRGRPAGWSAMATGSTSPRPIQVARLLACHLPPAHELEQRVPVSLGAERLGSRHRERVLGRVGVGRQRNLLRGVPVRLGGAHPELLLQRARGPAACHGSAGAVTAPSCVRVVRCAHWLRINEMRGQPSVRKVSVLPG